MYLLFCHLDFGIMSKKIFFLLGIFPKIYLLLALIFISMIYIFMLQNIVILQPYSIFRISDRKVPKTNVESLAFTEPSITNM